MSMYKGWYNVRCPNKNLQVHVYRTMKSFIQSQFGYGLRIWIFCGRNSNNRINHLHEGTLRLFHTGNQSSFENLLRKDCSVSIHYRNIHLFATEIYTVKNNTSTPITFK